MTEIKHTQGPWLWAPTGKKMREGYSQPYGISESEKPNLVAGVFGDVSGGESVAEANARLIAAAPELLELAEMVQRVTADTFKIHATVIEVMNEKARAIIAKATGK